MLSDIPTTSPSGLQSPSSENLSQTFYFSFFNAINTATQYVPTSAGTAGQVWTSDGAGAGKWAEPAGDGSWTETTLDSLLNYATVTTSYVRFSKDVHIISTGINEYYGGANKKAYYTTSHIFYKGVRYTLDTPSSGSTRYLGMLCPNVKSTDEFSVNSLVFFGFTINSSATLGTSNVRSIYIKD